MKRRGIVVLVTCVVLIVIGAFWVFRERSAMVDTYVNDAALSSLPKKDASGVDTSHLAKGIVAPTNKWFSGIALQKEPKTIFPSPLGFKLTASSFSFGLPTVQTSPDTISGPLTQVVTVNIAGATGYLITRYDELSVDVTFSGADGQLAVVRIIEGSPYIQLTALNDAHISATSTDAAPMNVTSTDAEFKSAAALYHIASFKSVKLAANGNKVDATVPKNGFVSFYALPVGTAGDALHSFAGAHITGANVTYVQSGDSYKTTLRIETDNNEATAYSYLPHQTYTGETLFSYATIYGAQKVQSGTDFSFTTPIIPVKDTLDLTHISIEDKALLIATLRQEINATTYTATDSYYGGKELYRSAQLLQLAEQLGQNNIASTIQMKLRQQLETWLSAGGATSSKYFYYDTKLQSLVGADASFGSEADNDHHFHYGYFIYAASILSKYDANFQQNYAAQINLIVADIANYASDEKLPLRRSYDAYFGHSWASGSAPFDDGNNQESSSEAINAWVGVSLWAQQTKDMKLQAEAGWMLSGEVAATKAYWLEIDTTAAPFNNVYTHSIVALNWGGKRDYSTFFSAEPSAKMGIQLLPLNPTSINTFDKRSVLKHVREAVPNNEYTVALGDYLLMYSGLNGVTNQLDIAKSLPDTAIDNGNSRSYMYAWIMSLK